MTAASKTGQGAEYAETSSAAYRAALEVIESVEPRIAAVVIAADLPAAGPAQPCRDAATYIQ